MNKHRVKSRNPSAEDAWLSLVSALSFVAALIISLLCYFTVAVNTQDNIMWWRPSMTRAVCGTIVDLQWSHMKEVIRERRPPLALSLYLRICFYFGWDEMRWEVWHMCCLLSFTMTLPCTNNNSPRQTLGWGIVNWTCVFFKDSVKKKKEKKKMKGTKDQEEERVSHCCDNQRCCYEKCLNVPSPGRLNFPLQKSHVFNTNVKEDGSKCEEVQLVYMW